MLYKNLVLITLIGSCTALKAETVTVTWTQPDSVYTLINRTEQNQQFDVEYTVYTIIPGNIFQPGGVDTSTKSFTVNLGPGAEFIWRIEKKKACLKSVRLNGGSNILEPVVQCLESVTITNGSDVQIIRSSSL